MLVPPSRKESSEPPLERTGAIWPIRVSTCASAVAQGALSLLLPLDGLAQGGIFAGFAVPGMLGMGAALVNIPGAMAVTRFGHRVVMTTGLACAALGAVVMALVPASILLMALAALVCGLGMGVWGLARLTYLAEAVPIERRGRVIASVAGVSRLGMLIGPALTGFGADAWGRSAVLYGAAGLNAASWLIIACWLPHTAPAASSPADAVTQNPFGLVARVAREHRRVLATAGAAMWALALLRSARLLLLPICGTVMGLDASQVGLVKSGSATADALLFYPVGLAMDRLGRKWTAVPSLLLLSLGVLTIAWADSYATLVVGGVIAGIGNGVGSGINMTLAGDFAPAKGRAEFIGVWRLWSDAGAAVAPFAMGAIAELLVLSAAGAVTAALGLGGMFVMAYGVREPLVREPSRAE
ncbi:MAG: MFS transporter [Deltaproteobacteria bacterium]